MATAKAIREVARAICRAATGDCCMDDADKSKCTINNCEIIPIADLAIKMASLKYRTLVRKKR